MEEKIKAFSQYQTYCTIAIVVLAVLPHAQAIDAQHARNSAIFHLVVTVLAVIGIVVLEVKKQALKKLMKREQAAIQNTEVTAGVWPPPPQK